MKTTSLREMHHIVNNFSMRNKASSYRMDTGSMTMLVIYDLIRKKLVRCINVSGAFLYVIPTKQTIENF
jgi:hypothetical protein